MTEVDGILFPLSGGSAVDVPDCFELVRGWLSPTESGELLRCLLEEVRWEQTSHWMYGREVVTPRLTGWFGDASYAYSGIMNAPQGWTASLDRLRGRVERAAGMRFNSCLCNRYRDGQDAVGWHRDDERGLRAEDTIASLSLGCVRDFRIRTVGGAASAGRRSWTLPLGHGDLLLMRAGSQTMFEHSLPRRAKVTGERLNLTFRWFDPARETKAVSSL